MTIEHYSSLASNRNYKIHNASERAAVIATLHNIIYNLQCNVTGTVQEPKQLAQITRHYLQLVNYSHLWTQIKRLID